MDRYKTVIGLEVHVQLLTNSKIFSSDSNCFGEKPNTNVSIVSLGHPGTLPKLNKKAVEFAVKMGLACNATIAKSMYFDRKNYFYPDLPKGYQITQDRTPICIGGSLKIKDKDGHEQTISLNRIHLEDDAGKSIHKEGTDYTLVDFNRAGTPLIEIVTEPTLHSAEHACLLLTEIRRLVQYLEICDGSMEEGSMRCDANVSIMLNDSNTLGSKVEIKNMNSVRNVRRAIEGEVKRQIGLKENGQQIISETRTFNADNGQSAAMRAKEELNDYRYFPEPDLSPVVIDNTWLNKIQHSMPILPWQYEEKLKEKYNLPEYDIQILTEDKAFAAYFEEVCEHTGSFKAVSNWMLGPIKSFLNEQKAKISGFPLNAVKIAELIGLVEGGKVNQLTATKQIFLELIKKPEDTALQIANSLNLLQINDQNALQELVDEVISSFPDKVKAYKKGKKGLLGMFMGEVMKRSDGKADPKATNKILTAKLNE